MNKDIITTIADLKKQLDTFITERDWKQYHTPKNLSMSIAIEAAELMEKFQFVNQKESEQLLETNREEIQEEVADVLSYLLSFANSCNIDLASAFEDKMKKNAIKYPVEISRGSYSKYTKLRQKSE